MIHNKGSEVTVKWNSRTELQTDNHRMNRFILFCWIRQVLKLLCAYLKHTNNLDALQWIHHYAEPNILIQNSTLTLNDCSVTMTVDMKLISQKQSNMHSDIKNVLFHRQKFSSFTNHTKIIRSTFTCIRPCAKYVRTLTLPI